MDVDVAATEAISAQATDATGPFSIVEEVPPLSKEDTFDTVPALHSYQIKPTLQDKFKENPVKEVIRNVLAEKLTGRTYDSSSAKRWTIAIANEVNKKVRELKMKRYKHIVQVIIGELKGAGVKCGVRCLWDSETDGYTSDTFINFEQLRCHSGAKSLGLDWGKLGETD